MMSVGHVYTVQMAAEEPIVDVENDMLSCIAERGSLGSRSCMVVYETCIYQNDPTECGLTLQRCMMEILGSREMLTMNL